MNAAVRGCAIGILVFVFVVGWCRGREGSTAMGQSRRANRAVSTIVFPPATRQIAVNHSHPAHRVLRCEACHVGASRSDRGVLPPPTESTCQPCHEQATDRNDPSENRCGLCHRGFELAADAGVPRVPTTNRASARLHFSHRIHASAGMRCFECHANVNREDDGPRHLPTMASCHGCHGGASPSAPSECTTCHLALPDGRMKSVYPEGWLNPPRWLRGLHHDRDWLVRHRWIAADQGSDCATCHTESECADCHDGRVRPDRVHPNDFITTHPQLSRRAGNRCTSCHSTQNFCTECHARLGLSTFSAPALQGAGRFHPPDDVWIRGPVLHGREARRSMNDCVSCHAESDCVSCHGAMGIGGGVSPHPPGFAEVCGRALRANARACQTCHGDLDLLRSRCP